MSKNAVAEGIINNVRKTIIRDQLTDPRFYEEMSKLLADLIEQRRDDTAAYEQFLRNAEDLVKKMANKAAENHPQALHGNAEAIAIFNNLPSIAATTFVCPADDAGKAALALELDQAMHAQAPAGWKGDDVKERLVLSFLHKIMQKDAQATMAIFDIIKNQAGY